MAMSAENRALLVRKFGRDLPVGDPKVTLTVSAIAKLLDEARKEGRRKNPGAQRAENLAAVLRAAGLAA